MDLLINYDPRLIDLATAHLVNTMTVNKHSLFFDGSRSSN